MTSKPAQEAYLVSNAFGKLYTSSASDSKRFSLKLLVDMFPNKIDRALRNGSKRFYLQIRRQSSRKNIPPQAPWISDCGSSPPVEPDWARDFLHWHTEPELFASCSSGLKNILLDYAGNNCRVARVLNGWSMYFDGTNHEITVDNFIYRVLILCSENPNEDILLVA